MCIKRPASSTRGQDLIARSRTTIVFAAAESSRLFRGEKFSDYFPFRGGMLKFKLLSFLLSFLYDFRENFEREIIVKDGE